MSTRSPHERRNGIFGTYRLRPGRRVATESEQLPLTHAGTQSDDEQGFPRVAHDGREEPVGSIVVEDSKLDAIPASVLIPPVLRDPQISPR
jgi:hypothetical protein